MRMSRMTTGIIMGVILIVLWCVQGIALRLTLSLMTVLCVWEMYNALSIKGMRPARWVGVIYALLAFRQKTLPFDLAAYSFVYVAVVLSPTWLLSGARYLYALCTFPLLLSCLPLGRKGHGALLGVHAALLALWVFGYTIAVQVL